MSLFKFLLPLLFLFCSFAPDAVSQQLTTLVLVRHAEKVDDGTKDPALSKAGKERAERLASLFSQTDITALYSTPYKRTEATAKPLAKQKGLNVQIYDPSNSAFLSSLLKKEKGGTIVIFGHSNTTPDYANKLLGEPRFEPFDESDYGNIIMVTISADGNNKLVHLRY